MGKYQETNVLKKRLGLKDSTISLLNDRLVIKDDIISSYKRDSVSYNSLIKNKDTEISLKDTRIKDLKSNNTKLHIQNILLKVVGGVLIVITVVLAVQ
jgi:predicted transcriptional regulator